ncbi:hypothetical protein TNCV_4633401, partial [Trichonephila clavipes]
VQVFFRYATALAHHRRKYQQSSRGKNNRDERSWVVSLGSSSLSMPLRFDCAEVMRQVDWKRCHLHGGALGMALDRTNHREHRRI